LRSATIRGAFCLSVHGVRGLSMHQPLASAPRNSSAVRVVIDPERFAV
jgi:hypothetical protein